MLQNSIPLLWKSHQTGRPAESPKTGNDPLGVIRLVKIMRLEHLSALWVVHLMASFLSNKKDKTVFVWDQSLELVSDANL